MLCSICLENVSDFTGTSFWHCTHKFHKKCIEDYNKLCKICKCPICNAEKKESWPPSKGILIKPPREWLIWRECNCNLNKIKWRHESSYIASRMVGYCNKCKVKTIYNCPDIPIPPISWKVESNCSIM